MAQMMSKMLLTKEFSVHMHTYRPYQVVVPDKVGWFSIV